MNETNFSTPSGHAPMYRASIVMLESRIQAKR
jgi:hypothetical protein